MGVRCSTCHDDRDSDTAGVDDSLKIVDIDLTGMPRQDSGGGPQPQCTGGDVQETIGPSAVQGKTPKPSATRPSNRKAKPLVTKKEQMMEVMSTREGFCAALDQSVSGGAKDVARLYGIKDDDTDDVVKEKVLDFRTRIMSHPKFDSSRVVSCVITERSLDATIMEMPFSMYLWEVKKIVPILRADTGLHPEKNGVQTMKANMMMLDVLLNKAAQKEVFGVKVKSVIRLPNAVGIKSLVDQLLQVSQRITDKNLVPILQPEIDIKSPDKTKCEQVLIDVLIDAFDRLDSDLKVCLVLTLPTNPNLYLPLTRHQNIIRLTALSGGYERATACQMLEQNVGMCANFARALSEGLYAEQEYDEFWNTLDASCQELYQASRSLDEYTEKRVRLADQVGFMISLTSTSVRPMLLEDVDENHLEEALGQCVLRILANPKFNSSRVIGVVMSLQFASLELDGLSTAQYVWQAKGVVPFAILSSALEAEANDVQMLSIPENWEELLDEAAYLGIFGVQTRSVIKGPNSDGIKAAVKQQFDVAKKIMEKGLLPNILIDVDDKARDKTACEELLFNAILEQLGHLLPEQKVSLGLPVPSKPNLFLQLIEHPNAIRVAAPTGSHNCMDACRMLSENNGMVGIFGRAFTERLTWEQKDDEFTSVLAETCKTIHQASLTVSAREEQMTKVSSQDGFVAILDFAGPAVARSLKRYGIDTDKCATEKSANAKMHQMITRIVTNDSFSGSRVIATVMTEVTMDMTICGMPAAKYLWSQKGTVPFLKIDNGLGPEADGVQLMKYDASDVAKLIPLLDRAGALGIFGTKQRAFIKLPNETGIKAVVDQQVEIGRQVCAKGLLPILQPEVDINSPQKSACEQMLLDAILDALSKFRSDEKVALLMTLPTKQNLYLPLMGHPNVLRLIALSGGYSRREACKMLRLNVNMIAGFGRAFVENLSVKQKEAEFSKTLDQSCSVAFSSSKSIHNRDEQMIKLTSQKGFFVGFDQDASKMPALLSAYGLAESEYQDEATMLEKAHQVHMRILKNQQFNGSRCIGAIMTEEAIALSINRLPPAKYLWDVMRIVTFMKLDKGLAPEKDGVRQMREIHDLAGRIEKATRLGIFGTTARSQIRLPNPPGIKAIVQQQLELATQVMQKDLVPIVQIEVDLNSPDKTKCERLLLNALYRGLEELKKEQKIVLFLTIPNAADTYSQLMNHPNVLRVAGVSGGHTRDEACKKLSENVGMIATFGRAFAEGLHRTQTEAQFTAQIVHNCIALYRASAVQVQTFDDHIKGMSRANSKCSSSVASDAESRLSIPMSEMTSSLPLDGPMVKS